MELTIEDKLILCVIGMEASSTIEGEAMEPYQAAVGGWYIEEVMSWKLTDKGHELLKGTLNEVLR